MPSRLFAAAAADCVVVIAVVAVVIAGMREWVLLSSLCRVTLVMDSAGAGGTLVCVYGSESSSLRQGRRLALLWDWRDSAVAAIADVGLEDLLRGRAGPGQGAHSCLRRLP